MNDINIGAISEALNDKMDRDSNNANPAVAKQGDLATLQTTIEQLQITVTNLQGELSKMLGRVDYTNASSPITLNPSRNETKSYTVPSDGYIHVTVADNKTVGTWSINDKVVDFGATGSPLLGNLLSVSQGDIIKIVVGSGTVSGSPKLTFIFYPQKS